MRCVVKLRNPLDTHVHRLAAQRFIASIVAVFAALGQGLAAEIPPEATKVIGQVHKAAESKNYPKLRSFMAPEFTWSFGGDGNADETIARWKAEPGYLRNLARITRLKCVYRRDRYVECPANAGTAFRAGFKEVGGTWRMEYFVEGD